MSILRPRGTERVTRRGRGSRGRGFEVCCPDVWVPCGQSVPLSWLSGLLSLLLTDARCQQPTPAPLPAPPAPLVAPLFQEDTWGLVALQGAASTLEIPKIPPAFPLPQAVPTPARYPPQRLWVLRQDFSFLSSSY